MYLARPSAQIGVRTRLPTPFLSCPLRAYSKTAGKMSSAKPEWLCIIPDHPGMLAKRMEVRPKHFEGLVAKPFLRFGGGTLDAHPKPGETMQLNGSAATIEADTREEVIALLKEDIYYTSGVWNVEGATIVPTLIFIKFKTGYREAQ